MSLSKLGRLEIPGRLQFDDPRFLTKLDSKIIREIVCFDEKVEQMALRGTLKKQHKGILVDEEEEQEEEFLF